MGWLEAGLREALAVVAPRAPGLVSEVAAAPLSQELRRLTFQWEDNRVIMAPVPLIAPPDPESPALPSQDIKNVAGRVVIFLQPLDVRDFAAPVAEIYVFGQGRWGSAGLGPSIGVQALEEPFVSAFALTFLEQLTHYLTRQHRPLGDMAFDFAAQVVSEPIGFGEKRS